MPIKFNCENPICERDLKVEDQDAGRRAKCPYCETINIVPPIASEWIKMQLIDMRGEEGRYVTVPPDATLADYIKAHNIDMVDGINAVRLMYRATTTSRVDVMEWFFRQGPESLAHTRRKTSKDGETLMYFAAEAGRVKAMECLKKHNAEIDVRKSNGDMPIHIAAFRGHERAVNWLLDENKELVHAKGEKGRTPMHYAAGAGKVEVMRLLKKRGGNVKAKDDEGFQPIHSAAYCDQTATGLKYLIGELGLDVNEKDEIEATPIFMATFFGRIANIEYLIRQHRDNVKVNEPDNRGITPLFGAALDGQIEGMNCLFNLCQEQNLELKLELNGVTLRRFAVAGNLTRVIQWLDEKGIQ